MQNTRKVEVSVVMPCLNEAEGVAQCIKEVKEVFRKEGIEGEIIVVDNNSEDDSAVIALKNGARVVSQPERGYGNTILKGLSIARGKFIVIGDADNSYDFREIPKFLEQVRRGSDLVIGSRYRGRIEKGAMPTLHYYVGNPFFSFLLRKLYRIKITDSHCGFGVVKREALKNLELESKGMEFASEILIKAAKANLRISEVPIVYRKRKGKSKLRTFQDGWRHLSLILKEYFN